MEWALFLVFYEIKIYLENCISLHNYYWFIVTSHKEILEKHSISVHVKCWSFSHFPEFYFSGYIFIHLILFAFTLGQNCPYSMWDAVAIKALIPWLLVVKAVWASYLGTEDSGASGCHECVP